MTVTQAVLEITEGLFLGRKTWLRPGEAVAVGRTAWADFTVAHDPLMADVHFRVECGRDACRIRDLGGGNGTLVNGKPLADGVLQNGDAVVAGRTRFRVLVDGGVAASPAPQDAAAPAPPEPVAAPATESCATTRGEGEPARVLEIASRLATRVPLHLLWDPRRAELPAECDPGNGNAPRLFDARPGTPALPCSPVLLSPGASIDPLPLLAAAWLKDAVIGIFSHLAPPELLDHIRQVACGTNGGPSGRGMIGCWWPAVSRALFAHDPSIVEALLGPIDGIFMEAETPDHWVAWTTPLLTPSLAGCETASGPPAGA